MKRRRIKPRPTARREKKANRSRMPVFPKSVYLVDSELEPSGWSVTAATAGVPVWVEDGEWVAVYQLMEVKKLKIEKKLV